MARLSKLAAPTADPAIRMPSLAWRPLVGVCLALAAVAGFSLGGEAATPLAAEPADPELARLLQFMAIVKGLSSIAIGALIAWRLGQPTVARLAIAYGAAGAMLFAAPGLVWRMQHVAAGALLFHAGLVVFLATAAMDGGGKRWLGQRLAARRARGSSVVSERR
jgi:hypothetical protein